MTPREKSNSNLRMWKPGQSGNPGGRKRMDPLLMKEIRDMTPELFRRLKQLAMGADTDSASIKAIQLILAYAWGSPDALKVEGEDKPTAQALSVEEKQAMARRLLTEEAVTETADDDEADETVN